MAQPSSAELRAILGANLKHLSKKARSISALCRELGINRTQFNRYLNSESFPRPDVLYRICAFFKVDARILLEPVQHLADPDHNNENGMPNQSHALVSEAELPNGFYRTLVACPSDPQNAHSSLVFVSRKHGQCIVRGHFLANSGNGVKGNLIQGLIHKHELGIGISLALRNTPPHAFLHLCASVSHSDCWHGCYMRTDDPSSCAGTRVVWHYLGQGITTGLRARRDVGIGLISALPPSDIALLTQD